MLECRLVPLKVNTGDLVNVAEHKYSDIKRYIEIMKEYECVQRLYLFGSALTSRCSLDSDVDIFVLYTDRKRFGQMLDDIYEEDVGAALDDIVGCTVEKFTGGNLHGLLRVIEKEGVVVYNREVWCCGTSRV